MKPVNSTQQIQNVVTSDDNNKNSQDVKPPNIPKTYNPSETKDLSDFKISKPSFSVLSNKSMNEIDLDEVISCINSAFKYERAKKDEAIKQLVSGDIFIMIKDKGKIISCAKCKDGSKVQSSSHKNQPLNKNDFYLGQLASIKKGAGKETLIQAKDYAKKNGFDRIVLDVWESPEHRLHDYYQKCGFTESISDTVTFGEQQHYVMRYIMML